MSHGGWGILRTVLVALLSAWFGRAAAQGEEMESPIAIRINRSPLIEAIKQFSEQTGIQVTADWEPPGVEDRPVDDINESLTPQVALGRILDGTGLVAKWHGRRTVRIYPVVAPHGYGNVTAMVVTGSRIPDEKEGPAPVRVYGREEIDRLGARSVADLASYFTQQAFSTSDWSHAAGAQYFQMRGLGVDTTLVLINGRRASPSASSVSVNAFDLNAIPITAVDRVEVMSDSASAIYGADAIGGVVNIILKTNIESPELHLHYGTLAGGGEERRAAGSFGKSSERFKAALTFDYFERGMLVGADRDLWRDQDYGRFGGTDYRVPTANPGNVYSLTAEPLPGLQTRQASVPVGSTGVGLTPDAFSSTAGVLSLDSAMAAWSIVPASDRRSVFGSAEFSPRQSWSVFGEALWTRSGAVALSGLPALVGQIVPEDNPYNPFGVAVAVDYSMAGMKPITRQSTTDLGRFVLGARSNRQRWDWELVLTASDEKFDLVRFNELDLALVQAALEPNAPGGVLNLFSDGPAGDAALLSSLVGRPLDFAYSTEALQLSGFVQGELFDAPGGASKFVVGGEWRQEKVSFFDGATAEEGIDVKGRRDIASWFAEIKLPLLEKLSIKLAVRGDAYEASKDSINPQYGLVWRPTRDWLIRAAYGRSFRPPSLLELLTLNPEYVLPVVDLRRGGAISNVRVKTGATRSSITWRRTQLQLA
ncbi:MAG TPA: TonB-dependent receptor [Steroidobacter sp.]|uniref:TonB-dependent receptor n=1 Tax=Steroidobacter sp. TaxID=1978227 RepID=UPI002EDA0506